MTFRTRQGHEILLAMLQPEALEELHAYLEGLSGDTRRRFGPHPFDLPSIVQLYGGSPEHRGYIARDPASGRIIAYAVVRIGFLPHDAPRLQSCGITPDAQTDCTFAPSVADAWQGCGLGDGLLTCVISDLKQHTAVRRIILWGGVQADNQRALRYYMRNGFRILGAFTYNGENYDMLREI
ncbi:MAG: GNAT family N-acetyltransferase [Bacteroidia bacterium]|nr:GNAT family N-acetyltransferase [Bacteroidia bacterium]